MTREILGAAFDRNGDALVNGEKYRRISKKDTTCDAYLGEKEYRYFKWERIKWRFTKILNRETNLLQLAVPMVMSADISVATVVDGKVTAVAEGVTTIYCMVLDDMTKYVLPLRQSPVQYRV